MAKLVIGNDKTNGVPVITKEIEKLPALGLLRAKGTNGMLIPSRTESQIMDFTGVTDVSDYILAYAYNQNTAISGAVDMSDLTTLSGGNACNGMFAYCTGLTSVDLGALTIISGISACNAMFYGCTGLTTVDLSSLTTVSGNYACNSMFANCTGLTTVDLSTLTTISGNQACNSMFYNCTGLTSVDISSLTTISVIACQQMFQGCRGLTSVDLSSLTTINAANACYGMFQGCTSLATVRIGNTTAIDFGTRYTNQFNSMFVDCTQNIDVYAPAANQTAIEAMSGYPNFGGTGTVTWHWNTAE